MTIISEDFDVRVKVIFPFLTKSLSDSDSERINATGTFSFDPQPQVDTTESVQATTQEVKEANPTDRIENLTEDLCTLENRFERIEQTFAKRASHIVLEYDPELSENESLANEEHDIFGVASGKITYNMFREVLKYQEKINKFISHKSIENAGALSGAA